MAVLAVALAATALGSVPNCALAARDAPAVTIAGPDCVWFLMWMGVYPSGGTGGPPDDGGDDGGNDGSDDEGEKLWDLMYGAD